VWRAVGATLLGVGAFTLLATSRDLTAHSVAEPTLVVAVGLVWGAALGLAVLSGAGPGWLRAFARATSGAVLYGLGSALIKVITVLTTRGVPATSPKVWGAAVVVLVSFAAGGWLIQQAFACGSAAVVVGALTTADPLVAVLLGGLVLGEGAGTAVLTVVAMGLTGLLAIGGALALAAHHPQAATILDAPREEALT
jgi:drug/metabolite transporter (DMT)-like permease